MTIRPCTMQGMKHDSQHLREDPAVPSVIEALCHARRSHTLADANQLAASGAHFGEDAAYAVQRGVAEELRWFATPVPRHWKSGGADRTALLTHAPLPDAGVWQASGDKPVAAGSWPFHLRLVEAEIALRLGVDVNAQQAAAMTPERAHAAIDAMAVSIEMVDTRWQQPLADLPGPLKLADMGVHGVLVLGDWVPYERRDWAAQACIVTIGKQAALRFVGTHSLADPAWLLPQWLQHVTQHYGTVPAGSVVTTGNWAGLLTAEAGDLVRAEFPGVGSVGLQL